MLEMGTLSRRRKIFEWEYVFLEDNKSALLSLFYSIALPHHTRYPLPRERKSRDFLGFLTHLSSDSFKTPRILFSLLLLLLLLLDMH